MHNCVFSLFEIAAFYYFSMLLLKVWLNFASSVGLASLAKEKFSPFKLLLLAWNQSTSMCRRRHRKTPQVFFCLRKHATTRAPTFFRTFQGFWQMKRNFFFILNKLKSIHYHFHFDFFLDLMPTRHKFLVVREQMISSCFRSIYV